MEALARPSVRPSLRGQVRRPLPWWAGTAVVALLTALVVGRLAAGAAAERARWGPGHEVLVVARAVPAGEAVHAGDLELRRLPRAAVPVGALRARTTGVAAVDLAEGEVLTPGRLVEARASAVAARLPPGTRGVAVAVGDASAPVRVGDRVDVIVTVDADAAGEGSPSFVVARAAPVVGVGADAVTLAVPLDLAPRVAWALTSAAVTLALVSAGR